jgi:hypothetical protein
MGTRTTAIQPIINQFTELPPPEFADWGVLLVRLFCRLFNDMYVKFERMGKWSWPISRYCSVMECVGLSPKHMEGGTGQFYEAMVS